MLIYIMKVILFVAFDTLRYSPNCLIEKDKYYAGHIHIQIQKKKIISFLIYEFISFKVHTNILQSILSERGFPHNEEMKL